MKNPRTLWPGLSSPSTRAIRDGVLDRSREMQIDGSAYLARLTAINADLKFDQILASIAPVSDFTGHIRRMRKRVFLFSGLLLMVVLPVTLLTSRKIFRSTGSAWNRNPGKSRGPIFPSRHPLIPGSRRFTP